MRNIFKTFKYNKILIEENKILKAQNDALTKFKENFDKYYHDISSPKIISRTYDNTVVLSGSYYLNNDLYQLPVDECKKRIIKDMSSQLMPYVNFDVVDNDMYGTKNLVGKLIVVTK